MHDNSSELADMIDPTFHVDMLKSYFSSYGVQIVIFH